MKKHSGRDQKTRNTRIEITVSDSNAEHQHRPTLYWCYIELIDEKKKEKKRLLLTFKIFYMLFRDRLLVIDDGAERFFVTIPSSEMIEIRDIDLIAGVRELFEIVGISNGHISRHNNFAQSRLAGTKSPYSAIFFLR